MKLFMIAKSNIKKNKCMSITLIALIIVASILLYIGSSIILDMNTFLEDKNEELNGSDFTVLAPVKYEEAIQKILKDMGGFTQYETTKAIHSAATFKNNSQGEKSQSMPCIIQNADEKGNISKLKIVNQGDQKQSNSILLPYYLKVAKGYKTGDEISIAFGGDTHKFTVYGFYEDIMFATPSNMSVYQCYVYGDEFNKLYNATDSAQFTCILTRLEKGTDTALYNDNFYEKINNQIPEANNSISSLDLDTMKVGAGIFLIIIMSIMIAFSMIIIVIALTVIRFAIVTYIEGNMKNIGSMEALGYTGKELVTATILQFGLLAAVGIAIGLILSISCSGAVTNLASSTIGLVWNGNVNLIALLVTIVLIMGLVAAIAYLTSAKLKKITPIIAMREGINTHNFKKNHLPVGRSAFGVNTTIGLKTLLQNMKQNITIMIIVMLLSFVCVLSFTANYNFNINNTALLKLIGIEQSDIAVSYEGKDSLKVFEEISKMEQVKSVIRLTRISMIVSMGDREMTPLVSVSDDFNRMKIKTIIKGRYPIHDNEVSVTGRVLKQLKAKIGDVITIVSGDSKKEFIVVGENQQINNLGRGACITEDGMKRINPDFIPYGLNLYLDNSKNTTSVIKEVEDQYRGLPIDVYNVNESFDTILASFNSAMIEFCIICILITLVIIALILFLLIRIKLMKERMRIGVNKALGYTTGQLILQIVISFCPSCILGAMVGTILAGYLVNPTFAAALSVSGIKNCHLTIDPLMTLITFCAISLFSIVATALVASSIKKITPRELFL